LIIYPKKGDTMGFFDTVKTVASGAMDAGDKMAKQIAKKMSNEQLLRKLQEQPSNRYLQEEAKNRGLS
jgi:hypothetical protein